MSRRLDLTLDDETGGEEHVVSSILDSATKKGAGKARSSKKAAKKAAKKSGAGRARRPGKEQELAAWKLKKTDQRVLKHLQEMKAASRKNPPEGGHCVASIPEIAEACYISPRQVQISTGRLIEAGMLERVGYDFANPDRKSRGTIYKVLV